MEMDVNRRNNELMTISALCYAGANASTAATVATTTTTPSSPPSGCFGILSRLFCVTLRRCSKPTHVSGSECNNTMMIVQPPAYATCNQELKLHQQQQQQHRILSTSMPTSSSRRRRTPQEIYFESRGKSCKKLLKFNGNSNKILLYPEEGWARTASSSYWTITPCWWQPNRCRIVEFAGTQRQTTKAKMLPMDHEQGSLLIAGHFRRSNNGKSKALPSGLALAPTTTHASATTTTRTQATPTPANEEFKLYLTSNISMEDYNMGYCLTGFVERRCQQTNTFQMTHFAVIKRQWPPSNLSDSK